MIDKYNPSLNDILIALLIHILIIISLSIFSVKVEVLNQELEVIWNLDNESNIENSNIASSGDQSKKSNTQNQSNNLNNQLIESISTDDNATSNIQQYTSIEPPTKKFKSGGSGNSNIGLSNSSLGGLSAGFNTGKPGNKGYMLEDDNGSIIVIYSVLPNPQLSDYGKVTLQFSLNSDGSVRSESIIPTLIDDPNYTRESIIALQKWKFSIRSYSKDKKYRISFIFNPE